jgi:hypothetical protein
MKDPSAGAGSNRMRRLPAKYWPALRLRSAYRDAFDSRPERGAIDRFGKEVVHPRGKAALAVRRARTRRERDQRQVIATYFLASGVCFG